MSIENRIADIIIGDVQETNSEGLFIINDSNYIKHIRTKFTKSHILIPHTDEKFEYDSSVHQFNGGMIVMIKSIRYDKNSISLYYHVNLNQMSLDKHDQEALNHIIFKAKDKQILAFKLACNENQFQNQMNAIQQFIEQIGSTYNQRVQLASALYQPNSTAFYEFHIGSFPSCDFIEYNPKAVIGHNYNRSTKEYEFEVEWYGFANTTIQQIKDFSYYHYQLVLDYLKQHPHKKIEAIISNSMNI